jgi:amidase
MKPLHGLSACDAARGIAAGRITSEALVRACLERVEEREGVVQAWEYLAPDRAIERARTLDRGPANGPLHGVPVGVKDIFDTRDMPTAYGSPIYCDHCPAWDASVVAAIRAGGGLVLGKTVTTEFAAFHPGKTTNPHHTGHTPGGSSSGSAAGVADFMVPLAIGTQTGGSMVRPAAFCGVVGYKPTFGYVNRAGLKPLAESLDTIGVFARDVADAALLASVLAGRPSLGGSSVAAAPRIGLCRTHAWPQAEEATISAVERARALLTDAGAAVTEVCLPERFRGLGEAQQSIMKYEGAQALVFERCFHKEAISAELLGFLDDGASCAPAEYDEAQRLASECRASLPDVFGENDALLTPSAPGEAPEGLSSTGDPVFNRIWTLLGAPCINLPAFTGPRGLPVGLQLVGRPGDDTRVIAVAQWVQEQLGRS